MQVIFNRKVLALAIASGLGGLATIEAQAAIILGATTPAPVTYAQEMVVDDTRPTTGFVNLGGVLDLQASLGFGVGTGAPAYIRIDLSNAKFGSPATFSGSVGVDALSAAPAQGGEGQSFLVYAYTPATPVSPNATVTIAVSNYKPVNKTGTTATYRLYTSAQDAAQGSSAYLATSTGPMWQFGPSYTFSSTAGTNSNTKIDVTTGSLLFAQSGTSPVLLNPTIVAQIGSLSLTENTGVYLAAGTAVATAAPVDVVGTSSLIKVEGDFSAFLTSSATTGKVYRASGTDCSIGATSAATVTASEALFAIGTGTTATFNGAADPMIICVTTTGTNSIAMNGGQFTATYLPTAVSTEYVVTAGSPMDMAKLVKNGKTFKVLNLPGSAAAADQFFIRLYNTGSTPATIRATVYNQDGTLVGTPNGTIVTGLAANTVYIVDLAKLQTAVTGTIGAGRAWARLEAESANISVALMLRNVASGVLVNGSASVMEDTQQ